MLLDNIAQDIQLGAIVEQVTALIACFMNLADVVVSTLAPAMMTFYDTGLKPIVEWIGEKLLDAIQFVMDLMNDWAAWFEENTASQLIEFTRFIPNVAAAVRIFPKASINAFTSLVKLSRSVSRLN